MKTAQASVLQFPKEPEAVALIREGAELKDEIDESTARLREIHRRLEELATFPPGKNTAKIEGQGIDVTIQRKEYVKFDQGKLNTLRLAMGNDAFLKPFGFKFEPRSKKELDAFLEYGDKAFANQARAAMTITGGAPAVTYKRKED
ncbi:hypothetical protein JCM15519_07370 [Fundidesulfovibrio butyratiphilus]